MIVVQIGEDCRTNGGGIVVHLGEVRSTAPQRHTPIVVQMGDGIAKLYQPPRCYRSVPLAQTCSPLIVVHLGEVRSTAPQRHTHIVVQMGDGIAKLYQPPRYYRSVPLAQTCSPSLSYKWGMV